MPEGGVRQHVGAWGWAAGHTGSFESGRGEKFGTVEFQPCVCFLLLSGVTEWSVG